MSLLEGCAALSPSLVSVFFTIARKSGNILLTVCEKNVSAFSCYSEVLSSIRRWPTIVPGGGMGWSGAPGSKCPTGHLLSDPSDMMYFTL